MITDFLNKHRPYRLYKPCGHKHREGEFAVRAVPGVGLVCAAGLVYTVCEECCLIAGVQNDRCRSLHTQEYCYPCEPSRTLTRAHRARGRALPDLEVGHGPYLG